AARTTTISSGFSISCSGRSKPPSRLRPGRQISWVSYLSYSISYPSNTSAEIFVVCRDFLAPRSLDPKFLDPKHVFKEVSALPPGVERGLLVAGAQVNVFQPDKARRQRSGYEDGNYTLHKTARVEEFVKSPDPALCLGSVNAIVFETGDEKE